MGISAREAAELAGVSKGAILKAIKTGKVSAQKEINGEWVLDVAELGRVYTLRAPGTPPSERQSIPDSTGELRLYREMISRQDDVIADLRQRLDDATQTATRLTLLLEAARPTRTSWLRRLFGG